MPWEWSLSTVNTYILYIQENRQKGVKNYRGISVVNAAYKILSFMLCEHLKAYLDTLQQRKVLSKEIDYAICLTSICKMIVRRVDI